VNSRIRYWCAMPQEVDLQVERLRVHVERMKVGLQQPPRNRPPAKAGADSSVNGLPADVPATRTRCSGMLASSYRRKYSRNDSDASVELRQSA
jgi:hypothetical protein